MRKSLYCLFLFTMISATAHAEVRGKEITYSDGEVTMKGYLAYNDAMKGKRPGVLVVHEWWGHNEYARKRARMLAEQGYTALAVDMYGDGQTADHPDTAGKFAGVVTKNAPLANKRFTAAMKTLEKQRTVDSHRIAAIGYCFGGSVVLEMARQGVDLKGVASFHGGLSPLTPAAPGKVKAKVAVFTGADDPMIPPVQVDAFRQEMDKAGVSYKVVSYPGVKHSFTNPAADEYAQKFNLPVAYDAKADEDSWSQAKAFLSEALRK